MPVSGFAIGPVGGSAAEDAYAETAYRLTVDVDALPNAVGFLETDRATVRIHPSGDRLLVEADDQRWPRREPAGDAHREESVRSRSEARSLLGAAAADSLHGRCRCARRATAGSDGGRWADLADSK